MNNPTEQQDRPMKARWEELKAGALEHYREISAMAHHWSSFVEHAILAYQDPESSQQGGTASQPEWKGMDEEFIEYIKNTRNGFANKISKRFAAMDSKDRVIIEDLLIAYDQMADKLQSPSNPPEVKEEKSHYQHYNESKKEWMDVRVVLSQPKPEKTAEDGNILQKAKDCAFNMYDIVDGQEVPWAKNKYEGDIGVKFFMEGWRQSQSPLRDALLGSMSVINEVTYMTKRSLKFRLDTIQEISEVSIREAKALLNNNT